MEWVMDTWGCEHTEKPNVSVSVSLRLSNWTVKTVRFSLERAELLMRSTLIGSSAERLGAVTATIMLKRTKTRGRMSWVTMAA